MITALVIIVALAIAIKEVPSLFRTRKWRDIAVFLVMLTGGTIFSSMAVQMKRMTSPLKIIEIIYGPINGLFTKWFG
ncbi:hypothetical protein DCC85_21420 [Paenibacillus sp. CAA11]|uniref:hypothetical protein n=1 Tax=Paenibacillus sp. CAA11 TaxID=1532905 RepID=UPI000D38FCE6|nr:hypothetical protein [Paenibacillus sp. CAA11]AWB46478.1 hypothetical protein DCC85_21420 [Paenibacillus sp. CAA11]